jgi:response regulator of citrate/malate metabolism
LKKNTEALAQKSVNAEIKALAEEVAKAAASADPFSDVALEGVENKILAEMEKFSAAVDASDVEAAKASAKQLLTYIKERNAKCRILK